MDQNKNVTMVPPSSIQPSAPPPSIPASAPPPYHIQQQTEGVFRECIPLNMSGSAQLAYIDVQPRCLDPGSFDLKQPPVFEPFSQLIQAANHWLANHPNMAVLKCDTTERRLQKLTQLPSFEVPVGVTHTPVAQTVTYQTTQVPPGQGHGGKTQHLRYDIDEMLKHESLSGTQSFVKGLRVWLRDKSYDNIPQQIGVLDTVPDEETIDISPARISDGFFVQGEKVVSFVGRVMDYKHHITFNGLQETVDKLNRNLEKRPIPGEIINLELVTFRRQFETSVHRDIDPEETACMVDMEKVTRRTKILRLFYVCGADSREPLGVHKLVPQVTKIPKSDSMGRPQFQKESQLYERFAAWLGQNQDVAIKSIIQSPVRYYYKQEHEKVYTASDSMDEVMESVNERHSLNTRLIFYTRPSSRPAPITCLTSRVFEPMRIGRKAYENMGQTFERINAWLRVTGLPIYHIETMEMVFTENDRQGVNTERTDHFMRSTFGQYLLVSYNSENTRFDIFTGEKPLYFTRMFQEPDPRTQPPTIDWLTQGGDPSTSCHIL